jgi:hypothetical protein
MKWRFSGGVDKEDLARPDKKLTEEEEVSVEVMLVIPLNNDSSVE